MIDFLAKELGIPTSNARILYDQWLENTLNTLSNGKPVTIEGLGSFTFENNELKFAPQPSLEAEVNRAYAGLDPLPEEKLGPTKFNETDFDDPFMEIIAPKYLDLNREPQPVVPQPEPEPKPVAQPEVDPFEPEPAFAEEPAFEPDPEPEPQPEPDIFEPMETTPTEEKKPVNLMPWIYTVLILLILSVGGYFGIGFYESWMESKLVAERTAEVAASNTTPDEPAAVVEPGTGYGLAGSPAVLEGRVYGIIVHSLPVQADSEAQCAKISPLGFRCSVVAAERNGATTYRVAIGQFESTATAEAAVSELPAEYQAPGKFFISRIQ
jgi:septal ring-binding cell division protein DamX/nucleoid DNA-binding protein